MQRNNDDGQKKKGRKHTKFSQNITPSMRIMQKNPPDESTIAYLVAATAASYVKHSALTLLRMPPAPLPPPEPTEADSIRINAALKEQEDLIKPWNEELEIIDKKIAELKANKAEIDPELIKDQHRLLKNIDLALLKKVEMVAENIREHAIRRIDLFFLLLIAVYKKNVIIHKGKTTKQHGNGSEITDTAACHDSLFPTIITSKNETKPNLEMTTSYWPLTLFKSNPMALPPAQDEQLLQDTYFAEVLNMTTELPTCVNQFDCHMEMRGCERSSMVKTAVTILNRTASGEYDPIRGLNEFIKALNLFFKAMEYQYIMQIPDYSNKERQGSFRAINESSLTANRNYVYMMLGLHKLTRKQYAAGLVYSGYIEQRILEMQNEILTSKIEPNALKKTGKK
jgi:hypothetical protein